MRIAVASDHAGFELKQQVATLLRGDGHDVVDLGAHSDASVDYPPLAEAAARMVAESQAERGVLVCGSGVGVSIVANKVDGVRAVNAHDADEARMSRRHNDANVLALSGARLGIAQVGEILAAFLSTGFDGGRHARRVGLIGEVERR